MTTDNFFIYLQNRPIQTFQAGGQLYSDTSPFSIPWFDPGRHFQPRPNAIKKLQNYFANFGMLGIKAKNNFTLNFMAYKKYVHGMIFILLSLTEYIFYSNGILKNFLPSKKSLFAE
jgi:hypothetical protein